MYVSIKSLLIEPQKMITLFLSISWSLFGNLELIWRIYWLDNHMFCFITLTQTRIVEYSKDNKAKFFSLSRKYCSRTPMFSAVQIFGVASLIWMGIKVNSSSPLQFDLDTMKFLRVVDSNFLSIQIDSHSLARHWKVVDLRWLKFVKFTQTKFLAVE